MNFEQIMQKAQNKAQKLANGVEQALRKNNTISPEEISLRLSNKLFKKQAEQTQEVQATTPSYRLTCDVVKDIFQKTNLRACWPRYWFHEDLRAHPLIQISLTNEDKTSATPIGALCILRRIEIQQGSRSVPDYIKQNSAFIEETSNRWYLGQISQLTDLSCSYILGFNLGYAGSPLFYRATTVDLINGHEDGRQVRRKFIEDKILEIEADDPFEQENDSHKLSELFRVGYYIEKEDEVLPISEKTTEEIDDNQST